MLNGKNYVKKGSKVQLIGRGASVIYDAVGKVNDIGCEYDRFGSITPVIEVDWPEGVMLGSRWRADDLRVVG